MHLIQGCDPEGALIRLNIGQTPQETNPSPCGAQNYIRMPNCKKKNKHPALEENSDFRKFGDLPKVKYKMY